MMAERVKKTKVAERQLHPDWVKTLVSLKKSWVAQAQLMKPKKQQNWARVWVLQKSKTSSLIKTFTNELSSWDLENLKKSQLPIQKYSTAQGPLWIVKVSSEVKSKANHKGH